MAGRPKGSKNKGPSKPRKPRTRPDVPGASGNPSPPAGHNSGAAAAPRQSIPPTAKPPALTPLQEKQLAFQQKAKYEKAQEKYQEAQKGTKKARAELMAVCKEIKAESGARRLGKIKTLIALDSPEGEEEIANHIRDQIEAAQWVEVAWANAIDVDLFDEPDRTPIDDRAFNEGQRTAMEEKPAHPPYSPGTTSFTNYMDGYHSVSEARIREGIKAPDAEPAASNVVPMRDEMPWPDDPPRPPVQ